MSPSTKKPGGIAPSSAHKFSELLSPSPGALVSRTITQHQGNGLTLFAFDEGAEIEEHASPSDAYVQVIEGELELIIGGESVPARPGELVLMPSNVPHALRALAPTTMLLAMFRH